MKNAKKTIKLLFGLFLLLIISDVFFSCKNTGRPENQEETRNIQQEPKMAYGLLIDTLDIITDVIGKNQHLSDILLRHHIDYPTIDKLVKRSKDVFNVRKIRRGNKYSVIVAKDSIRKAKYFVYEISPVDYVVFNLSDSVYAYRGKKEITREIDTTSGIISTSLWNAMVDNGNDPNLANELSEIYAWTIDFFGIQKGDSYKVIYENLYVESTRIGIGKIMASSFNHYKKDHYAFYFVQDSIGDYFDEEANSMRRTFLKAPLRYKRISSRFSYSRFHPILKKRMPHLGVDYAAPRGTPVHAVGDGLVTFASRKGANGKMIKIRHNGTYTTAYLHLSGFGKGVKNGVHVTQGQVIGYVGSTGRSTGPHLDFRFYKNAQPVDPLKVKSPPANPVDSAYLKKFSQTREKWMTLLDSINISH